MLFYCIPMLDASFGETPSEVEEFVLMSSSSCIERLDLAYCLFGIELTLLQKMHDAMFLLPPLIACIMLSLFLRRGG